IVAPASLTDSWRRAMSRTCVNAPFTSVERLSRAGAASAERPELVVIDEAHNLRNPRTRRYAAVAGLCKEADVLLLSATPLHNRRDDLVAQLALFLGDTALAASDDELARFIVRRRADDASLRLPMVRGPHWIRLPVDEDLLDDLLALPPPVAGADEGTAGALVTYSLLRQWSSSRAALVAALRRRLAKAIAMIDFLEAGRWPSRDQLAAWSHAETAVQLALPELLTPLGKAPEGGSSMLEAVSAHADALRVLLARLRDVPDPDPARANAIVDICRAHPTARVLAFSQYAETVRTLSRLLMARLGGVAALTAHGGRVAGGRISRREVLAQFVPTENGADVRAADRIRLLTTTDVLSEGLDLQRASVVIHLDLPWNPARLEQRVGRARRLGAAHDFVSVYALTPPASSERMLRVVDRLRAKLGLAGRLVGLDCTVVPEMTATSGLAPPELTSEMLAFLESWRGDSHENAHELPACAGVAASNDGFLALLAVGPERLLIAAVDGARPSLDAMVVSRALAMCRGSPIVPCTRAVAEARMAVQAWYGEWSARRRLAVTSARGARVRLLIAGRISSLLAAAPRHERALLIRLTSQAQHVLRSPLGAGAERTLLALSRATEINAEWLERLAALLQYRSPGRSVAAAPELLVLILLRHSSAERTRERVTAAAAWRADE
ncbi:MAG TPA: helicase-related protein, partial [Gemmatimonadaceae bacterium]|nr:helicase-related protein [Gemmatimonadaceae bacterium]